MIVERYIEAAHYEMINEWSRRRSINLIWPDGLPGNGYVVRDCAAAFLYRTDSAVGYIDNLVSNPLADDASMGLNEVLKYLVRDAKEIGIKLLVGYTEIPGVASRCEKIGFKRSPNKQFQVSMEL